MDSHGSTSPLRPPVPESGVDATSRPVGTDVTPCRQADTHPPEAAGIHYALMNQHADGFFEWSAVDGTGRGR